MLIDFELSEFLIYEGPKQYTADINACTPEDIEKIKKFDKSYFVVYGYHVIVNYEELDN
ncbi:hypothetical protein M2140_000377 [Clostridiales Family XIII bacterium PM5-7]